MKIHIVLSNGFFEFCISSISERLPCITHMIEVTVFYSFSVWVKKPCIHHRNSEMVWMPLIMIKWGPVLARCSLVDKYCSCENLSINTDKIRTIVIFRMSKKFFCHIRDKFLIWIVEFCLLIIFEKILNRNLTLDSNNSFLDIFKHMTTMSSSLWWPLVPIFFGIKYGKCGTGGMNALFCIPSWQSMISGWLFYEAKWCPEDNPMFDSVWSQELIWEFCIMLLMIDTPKSWKYLIGSKKLMSSSSLPDNKSSIVSIVVIEYPWTRTIVDEIFRNVLS